MDKNTIIGFLLMAGVLFGFNWLNQPTEAELAQKAQKELAVKQAQEAQAIAQMKASQADSTTITLSQVERDSLARVNDSLRQVAMQTTFGPFAPHMEGESKTVTLKNENLSLELTTQGGYISQAVLNNYTCYDSTLVSLFEEQGSNFGFQFPYGNQFIDTRNLYFEPIVEAGKVTMHLDFQNGNYFNIVYTLAPESYMVDMNVEQQGMENVFLNNLATMKLSWNQHLRRQEKGRKFEEKYSAIYYKAGDDVEEMSAAKDDRESVNSRLKWIGYKNQFFSTVLIAGEQLNYAEMTSTLEKGTDSPVLKRYATSTEINYDRASSNPISFRIFMGPNSYPLLKGYDSDNEELDLDRLVPLGMSMFRWINTWIVIPVFNFLSKYIGSYGVIILLLTLFIKMLLMPLTFTSYMSTARMRVLKPQVDEINAKYPGNEKALDRQKATMNLYQSAGVNPMSGCLPMLLQMPILLAMFSFFPSSIELRGESFLWAHDLSTYDSIFEWNTQIPLISNYFGNHVSLFCLLMTITNILYTRINMQSSGQEQMPGMKFMMYVMPLMFLFIFNSYASGLSYYYFVSTLITIIQTYIFRKSVNEEKVLAKLHANQKKPRKKKSGFMERLEEAQRQQQAALKKQREEQQRRKR